VLGGDGGVRVVDLVDQRLSVVLAAEGAGDLQHLVAPGREVLGRALDARDGRGDRGEEVVVLLGQPGVGGDDQVRREGRDLLVLDAVGLAQHLGLGALEEVVRPGPRGLRLLAVPLGDAHRHDAELQQGVLLGEADADHALGGLGDDGLAELVGHGRREDAGGAVAGGLVGGRRTLVARRVAVAARGQQQGRGQRDGDEAGGGTETHGSP
jgi:hypothetical protein